MSEYVQQLKQPTYSSVINISKPSRCLDDAQTIRLQGFHAANSLATDKEDMIKELARIRIKMLNEREEHMLERIKLVENQNKEQQMSDE